MIHANTIKAEIRKKFEGVKVESITRHKFGIFTVKCSKNMHSFIKRGFIVGTTDFEKKENGVMLDDKITWS